jgi:hypothetical protein
MVEPFVLRVNRQMCRLCKDLLGTKEMLLRGEELADLRRGNWTVGYHEILIKIK